MMQESGSEISRIGNLAASATSRIDGHLVTALAGLLIGSRNLRIGNEPVVSPVPPWLSLSNPRESSFCLRDCLPPPAPLLPCSPAPLVPDPL